MNKIIPIVKTALFWLATSTQFLGGNTDVRPFLKSFVQSYDISVSGRYAHEYHPFLLRKTATSLHGLEDHLVDKGFSLDGRMIVMGYEGNAIPSYFPSFRDCDGGIIDDEYIAKELRGWSLQLHNRFGLMAGFLFRDINQSPTTLFEHINPHRVELFHPQMAVFQEDAFGELYPFLNDYTEQTYQSVSRDNVDGVWKTLVQFFGGLYGSQGKTGDANLVGTQDILFTLENARHLASSKLPLLKFYMGGDITYPIVLSKLCGKEATFNAQTFVQKISKQLIARDGQKTAYIFNSFVDGVGKSTLLSNISNFKTHGTDVESYDSVDNTSSLTAEVFDYDTDVFIADLPAQVSHFTYKPDGIVFVDMEAVGSDIDQVGHMVGQCFYQNSDQLIAQYQAMITACKNGDFKDETQDLFKLFIKNLVSLKRIESNHWIPIMFDEHYYLVDRRNPAKVRVALPLGDARSEGLKNLEPEQMLFTKGIGFPLVYQQFLDDLSGKLADRGVQRVVFIDFLSMYSRSSRENIRVNYLLQQLVKVSPTIHPHNTFYRNFISNSELLALLNTPRGLQVVGDALFHESKIRYAFHHAICSDEHDVKNALNDAQVTELLERTLLSADDDRWLRQMVDEKLSAERASLRKQYGQTKEFVNVHGISFQLLETFSNYLCWLCGQHIYCPEFNKVWSGIGSRVKIPENGGFEEGPLDTVVTMESGPNMRAKFVIHPENRNPALLDNLFRMVRTSWYGTLMHLRVATQESGGPLCLSQFNGDVLPLVIRRGTDGMVYVVQKLTDNYHQPSSVNTVQGPMRVDMIGKYRYFLDLSFDQTYQGLFGFGISAEKEGNVFPYFGNLLYWFVSKYQDSVGKQNVVYCQDVLNEFDEYMNSVTGRWLQREIAARTVDADHKEEQGANNKRRLLKRIAENQREPLKLLARSIATLEMVVRDVRSDVVVEVDNKKSFEAAVGLVEKVMFPQLMGIAIEEPLFDTNESIDSVIPYELF